MPIVVPGLFDAESTDSGRSLGAGILCSEVNKIVFWENGDPHVVHQHLYVLHILDVSAVDDSSTVGCEIEAG